MPTQSLLLALPDELLLQVVKSLYTDPPQGSQPLEDLKALRKTCKRLCNVANIFFFNRFTYYPIDPIAGQARSVRSILYLKHILSQGYSTWLNTLNLIILPGLPPPGALYRIGQDVFSRRSPGFMCIYCGYPYFNCRHARKNLLLNGLSDLKHLVDESVQSDKLRRINIKILAEQRAELYDHPSVPADEQESALIHALYHGISLPLPQAYNGELVLSMVDNYRLNPEPVLRGISGLVTRLRVENSVHMHPTTQQENPVELVEFLRCIACKNDGGRLRELYISFAVITEISLDDKLHFTNLTLLVLHAVRFSPVEPFVKFLGVNGALLLALSMEEVELFPPAAGNWNQVLCVVRDDCTALTRFSFQCGVSWHNSTACLPLCQSLDGQAELDCHVMCEIDRAVDTRRFARDLIRKTPYIGREELQKLTAEFDKEEWDEKMYWFMCQMDYIVAKEKEFKICGLWGDGLVDDAYD
ncbi:hypothetical protein DRE_01192 [Drechslerella stenobrocha 248]|uniref:F-box domain-containing protein n=1 Tax=Drechslerella stenobrocha 248 TaxID=1043628 RepID=W7HK42_9PEZI|nr:hypothetical protein DRE_01192 [Drechslerella stenobrocha 248]